MIKEKQDLMISPSGGDPFLKTAHFLKPISPSSIDEPFFKHPASFSSLPSKWNLKVEFPGWQHGQKEWRAWVDRLAPLHQSTWKKAGIYEAILSSTYQIKRNTDLVYGLAERWCRETNTFIFPWGEATVTLEDVMVLGGYSVLGDSILSPLNTRELKEAEYKLEVERSKVQSKYRYKAPTSVWFKKFINSGSELEHEAFLAYWLSRYVFNNEVIMRHVLSMAIRLARGMKVALAPAVLASIYKDLSLLGSAIVDLSKLRSCDDTIYLKSPLQFVQVWAWERVLELSPLANVVNNAEPRLARWDRVNGLGVKDLRRVLDSAGEHFIWRPYALAIGNSNFPKHYLEKEKWVGPGLDDEFLSFAICLRVSELNGFGGSIEQYLPHRVARQFGYDQDIPCFVARADERSDSLSGKENPDIAWKHHIREIKKLSLYVPSRLSEADVSTRYMKWWSKTASGFKHINKLSMPRKRKAESIERSILMHKQGPRKKVPQGSKERIRNAEITIPSVSNGSNGGNDSLVPPGFSSKYNKMEAGYPMDEDELTISEVLKKIKKHNVETRKRGDDSIPGESSADILMPERLEKEDIPNPTLRCRCKPEKNLKNVMASNVSSPDIDMTSIIGNEWASRVEEQVSELKCIVRSLKNSETLKYQKKHKITETAKGGDSVKLSGTSTLEEGSVRSMQSQRFEKEAMLIEGEALIGGSRAKINLEKFKRFNATCPGNHIVSIICNGCSSCSSSLEKQNSVTELQKQVSDLQARVTRLESVGDVSQQNRNGAGCLGRKASSDSASPRR